MAALTVTDLCILSPLKTSCLKCVHFSLKEYFSTDTKAEGDAMDIACSSLV